MSGTAPQGAGPGAGGPGIPGTQTPVPVPTVPAPTQAPPPPAAQPVTPGTATAAATTSTQPMSNQNLNQILPESEVPSYPFTTSTSQPQPSPSPSTSPSRRASIYPAMGDQKTPTKRAPLSFRNGQPVNGTPVKNHLPLHKQRQQQRHASSPLVAAPRNILARSASTANALSPSAAAAAAAQARHSSSRPNLSQFRAPTAQPTASTALESQGYRITRYEPVPPKPSVAPPKPSSTPLKPSSTPLKPSAASLRSSAPPKPSAPLKPFAAPPKPSAAAPKPSAATPKLSAAAPKSSPGVRRGPSGPVVPTRPETIHRDLATPLSGTNIIDVSGINVPQVTDYLLKRGFTKTESIFRQESSHLGPDGRPIHTRFEDKGPQRYRLSINALKDWVEGNLDIYKFELAKLLWPVFVYSWMELVNQGYVEESKNLVKTYTPLFENGHADDLKVFSTITLPQQIKENATTKLYRDNKFHIPLNQHVVGNLFHFLERERDNGGAVVTFILQTYCAVDTAQRGPIEPFSFEAIFRRAQGMNLEEIDQHEGIPGVKTGVTNREALDKSVVLRLGPLPMDDELRDDLRAELADADARQPPPEGKISLLEEFEQKIKREESAEAPHRNELPLPPPRARDVAMEMAKVRENRDRFKIEGRTGGVGVPVSACMFTFHNSLGSVACIDFSNDHELVAVGTTDSYIRVWHMEGKALKSKAPHEKDLKVSNRKLIGHFGPVYSVAFSDGVQNGDTRPSFAAEGKSASSIELGPKLLLSASADGQIRLWSLDLWQCLCIYKGHDGPVFRVQWGPHGHYFLSGGWDKTARIWMQDHASAQRLLVGHDTSISAIAWHPNGTYVFTASDETDKTIRMWSVVTGSCVRVFTGHTEYVSSIVCAPNGKVLASGDSGGNIFFWDLEKGTRIKRSRGHAKGGIWSMDFSVESNVLVSGGQDGSVRLWDVELPAEGHKAIVAQSQPGGPAQPQEGDAAAPAAGSAPAGSAAAAQGASAASAATGGGTAGTSGKKKGKEVMVTPDQISAFATKKTPVMSVHFTRMNLVVAGGCYDADR